MTKNKLAPLNNTATIERTLAESVLDVHAC